MSRIFEALQRSDSEQSGIEFPNPESIATQLLEAAEQATARAAEQAVEHATVLAAGRAAQQATAKAPARDTSEFETGTLQVSISPNSRLVSLTNAESLGAEKFRFLGVRLRQLQQTRQLKRVLITSTIPEEGKSMVSANLAVTLARKHQQRILLIEGDLRRPVFVQQFGLGKLAGLSEWLKSGSGTQPNIYHLEGPGLWFLPAGRPPDNPLELMQSGRLSQLLNQLNAQFDWIVIDSPPVLPLADTSVWTRLVDGVFLVAREGKTEKKQLKRGLEALDQSKLLGVILNSCTNTDHTNYYQRYRPAMPLQDAPSAEK